MGTLWCRLGGEGRKHTTNGALLAMPSQAKARTRSNKTKDTAELPWTGGFVSLRLHPFLPGVHGEAWAKDSVVVGAPTGSWVLV